MPPPPKRRRASLAVKPAARVEEVSFDSAARAEYLTGFHKRKQARIKHSKELAAKKEREEHLKERRELRQQRKDNLEEHVRSVNMALGLDRSAGDGSGGGAGGADAPDGDEDEWMGIDDGDGEGAALPVQPVDREDEYVDEEAYTTVTVEAVGISKGGFENVKGNEDREADTAPQLATVERGRAAIVGDAAKAKAKVGAKLSKDVRPKKKRKKFRYETKQERKVTKAKERSKNSKQAQARRQKT